MSSWNSDRGRQEQSLIWLRKRLKTDALFLLTDHEGFFNKYPPHISPAVVAVQDIIQQYVDFKDGALEGPVDRYYVVAIASPPTSTHIAILDKGRVEEYFVRELSTHKEYRFELLHGVPMVQLPGNGKPRLLEQFLRTDWTVGGPGVIFGGPVVEVTF